MFRVARDDAERQICDKLKKKLDEFIELENYDWLLGEPRGHASSYITDLIAFLQSTFFSFTNLPVSICIWCILLLDVRCCLQWKTEVKWRFLGIFLDFITEVKKVIYTTSKTRVLAGGFG